MKTELLKLKKAYKSWPIVADQLGITSRHLRRYVAGSHQVPKTMQKLILRLVAEIR